MVDDWVEWMDNSMADQKVEQMVVKKAVRLEYFLAVVKGD